MQISKKEIISFYNGYRTGEYGRHTSVYEQEGRLSAILSLIDLSTVARVLDVGCGVGFMAREYARFFRGQVIGVDFSIESIREAKEKAAGEKLTNLEFMVMDAEGLGFKDDTFDIVISSEVLEHPLEPEEALREMCRIAKKRNGKIVITTPNPWNWNIVWGKLGRNPEGQIYDEPINPLKLAKMVEEAGMKVLKRKGTYYLPPLFILRGKLPRLIGLLVRLSRFIEKFNLLPYFGLYQVLLLEPVNR